MLGRREEPWLSPSTRQQLNPGGRGGLAGGEEEPVRMLPQEGSRFFNFSLESKSLEEEGGSSLLVVSWSLDVTRAQAETCNPEICW